MAIWATQKANPQERMLALSRFRGRKMSRETRTWECPPSTRKAPKRAEKICPVTVAAAAPATPQSKTMMNKASSRMLVTAWPEKRLKQVDPPALHIRPKAIIM